MAAQPLRFKLIPDTSSVLDTLTQEIHQFASFQAAWFGRGELERKYRPAAKVSTKEARRQERREAGLK